MGQGSDDVDASIPESDGEDGAVTGDGESTLIERHFLLLLAITLGFAGVAGVGVTYADYGGVGKTLRSIPYVGTVVDAIWKANKRNVELALEDLAEAVEPDGSSETIDGAINIPVEPDD